MEETFGNVLGFDDCMDDVEKLIQSKYAVSHEAFMEDLIEKALETTTNIISWVIREAYTILNQEIEFLFLVSKEEDSLMVVYLGYQESGNQLVS